MTIKTMRDSIAIIKKNATHLILAQFKGFLDEPPINSFGGNVGNAG